MTKRLILIRHAKSSWEAPFDDHARTLDARGREAATGIGRWLKNQGHLPEAIYSSDAARTRETSDRIVAAMGSAPEIVLIDTLYHSTPDTLLNVLRRGKGDCVALVAHNPGIAFFAEQVVVVTPDHNRFADFPTCATLVCDFDIKNWAEVVPRSGQVVDFIVPRDLGL